MFAGLPKHRCGTRIGPSCKHAYTAQDVRASGRSEDHGPGCAAAFIAGSVVEQIDLRERGMEADEHRLGSERKCVAYDVMAAGEVEHAMRVDALLNGGGIVADAIAFHAERVYVDPFAAGRKGEDGRGKAGGGG